MEAARREERCRMMRYGLFTERMKALFGAKKPDEHMFLLSIDFLNFKLVNHLYGSARGTELLRAVAEQLDQIPEILLWDRIYADQFTFLVRSKQTDIIPAYRRYAEEFLAREQEAYPACNLRLACGIYPLEGGDVLTAVDNVNAAREEAKRGDAPLSIRQMAPWWRAGMPIMKRSRRSTAL